MLTHDAAYDLARTPSGMDAGQVDDVLTLLLAGGLAVNEGAGLLAAWSERGETGVELAAMVKALLARAVPLGDLGRCLDLCGTGGSGRERFNVSTTAAFVLAAAGVPVAKHGNRGSAKPNGSFDLLERLGVRFDQAPTNHARLLRTSGVCFLFARAMHPAVAAAAPYRKAAGRRTIFNLAGPLANPARPAVQLIGTVTEATAHVVAEAMVLLGTERALVVWGEPGIDEVSVSGRTRWLQLEAGVITPGGWHPHDPVPYERIPGGDATTNADEFHRLLAGGGDPAVRRMVVANAAAALDLWHGRPVLADAHRLREVEHLLTSGAVAAVFARHRDAAAAG